ncbi:Protamine-3 [Manis javanica]|nr:Protamine-3 [Manis javanica]
MGSHCAKLSTGGGQGHKSTMKKLLACVSQDSFSLSTEGEEQEQGEEEGEEELPVQGKLLLMEPEQQEEGAERKTLWPRRDPSPGRCTPDVRPAITAQEEVLAAAPARIIFRKDSIKVFKELLSSSWSPYPHAMVPSMCVLAHVCVCVCLCACVCAGKLKSRSQ